MPTKIVTIDLERPLPPEIPHAANYDTVWAIVLRHQIPVGQVEIGNRRTPVLAAQLRHEIIRQLGDDLLKGQDAQLPHFAIATGCQPKPPAAQWQNEPELEALLPGLAPQPGHTFFLSVVVCTRDRPQDLRMCLETLVQLEAGRHQLELIVVDNNPASGQTQAVVADFPQVRYETELRPGVAYGRNKGLTSARGDIVAYIDDDVKVPPHWPSRVLAPFADPRVMCVSGLVLPLELESESQEMFEKYGALGRGYRPR
ncbi:MAG: glycosyltransferase family A protein, partial [Chloroflexota bacterium]